MSTLQRPLALFRACTAPRPATHRALRYTTAAPAPTPTPTPPPPPPAVEATTDSPQPTHPSKSKHLKSAARAAKTVPFTPAPQPQLPLSPPRYHVARSLNKNLPIYTDYKRGGNLRLTTVRKVTGDVHALRDELQTWLAKKDDDVKVNSLTGHVVVKGHCTAQIADFLRGRGM